MTTLLIDGAAPVRTVALAEGPQVLGHATLPGGRASPWFQAIESLLTGASLDRTAVSRIAVCLGPGSYTGIRGTLAIAQGWHLARGTPVLGLASPDVLAHTAWRAGRRGRLVVVIDAQRGEFYLAGYELSPEAAHETMPLRLATREEALVHLRDRTPHCVGPDAAAIALGGETLIPSAVALAELAARATVVVADPGRLEPIYLRATSFVKAPPARNVV